jgi:O-acetylhomoserine (thiol)-lyase
LPRYGIEVTFVDDPDNLDSWKKAIRPNTKAFFGESIANPSNAILDIENIAKIAHENGIPLIVDNTVATPFLLRPIEFGADIVVHSATKYMGGHGTTVAGVIVDSGKFDWKKNAAKFPQYNTPDPSYGGLVYADALGELAYILRARIVLLRDFGAAVSPFNAFLIAQGLETLSLRMERHIQNARAVATWLEKRSEVEKVNYASLDSHPHNKWAKKYTPAGSGAVLSFEIKGGIEAGKKFVEALELHSHVANIGDVRSLVIHPASTTHSQLTPQEQLEAGVTPGLIRLAVGIENINDILADIEIGFNAAKGA